MKLSLHDYQQRLTRGELAAPSSVCPYFAVDPVRYHHVEKGYGRGSDLGAAFRALQCRTTKEYFRATYPLQSRTLDYSSSSFPAYRFILPQVIAEDWLAIVDWHKIQRDHVLHQSLTGYVVQMLLGEGAVPWLERPECGSLLERCVNATLGGASTACIREFANTLGCSLPEKGDAGSRNGTTWAVMKAVIREVAYVAAVFHDLGYPWQYLRRVADRIDGGSLPAFVKTRSAREVLGEFGGRLVLRALAGYSSSRGPTPSGWQQRMVALTDSAMAETHGMPGALGFLSLNDSVREYPCERESPWRLLCVEWAAAAIMMHDLPDIYWSKDARKRGDPPENPFLRLSFEKDPVSAIVTLADVIEDFERPMVTFVDSAHPKRVGIEYRSASKWCSLKHEGETLALEFGVVNRSDLATYRHWLRGEQEKYFHPKYGYLDLSGLGIRNVTMDAKLVSSEDDA